jgi:hypothetical protein
MKSPGQERPGLVADESNAANRTRRKDRLPESTFAPEGQRRKELEDKTEREPLLRLLARRGRRRC